MKISIGITNGTYEAYPQYVLTNKTIATGIEVDMNEQEIINLTHERCKEILDNLNIGKK